MSIRSRSILAAALLLAGGIASVPALAQPKPAAHPAATPKAPRATERVGDLYPLSTCPISGGKLGSMGDPIVKLYDGREVRFCCKACPPKFEKDLAASLATLDEALIKDQLPLYPLDTSVVSGKKLGQAPVDFVYANRLIRVADKAERAEFMQDPKKFLAALDKAVIEKQSKDYPLTKCPVSGDKLGDSNKGETKDMVIAGRLIRLCCDECVIDFNKDPAKFIAKIDEARKAGGAQKDAAPKDGAPKDHGDHGKKQRRFHRDL